MDAGQASGQKFSLTTSRHFAPWLAEAGVSLALTTYQAGKLFLIGVRPDGELSIFERSFPRCMGLAVTSNGRTIALATQYQIHRFDNVLPAGDTSKDGFDALYVPHAGWVTGDVDAHDVAFGNDERPLFANTLFSCIATVSDDHSFRPIWQPPFISKLAPEDRCHLNGMTLEAGHLRYVTAVSRSDVADGWRDHRRDGGVVIDVASGDVVAEALSMPHSPRLHAGRLWLLNSGAGEFGYVDLKSGRFKPIAFCPGYARGLAFVGNYAIIGLSLARENGTFSGLQLDDSLQSRGGAARCGLAVIELDSGNMVGSMRIEGVIRELYDVAVLPNVVCPSLVGFKSDEIRFMISIEPAHREAGR